jgi:hypothetical protein
VPSAGRLFSASVTLAEYMLAVAACRGAPPAPQESTGRTMRQVTPRNRLLVLRLPKATGAWSLTFEQVFVVPNAVSMLHCSSAVASATKSPDEMSGSL